MSTAEQVDVRITGNASGAVEASKLSQEAVSSATTIMREKLISLGLASKENFEMMGTAASAAATKVTESGERMKVATEAMAGHYERLSGVMSKLNTVFLGVGAALAGGEGFEKAIEATTTLTSETLRLSKTMGISLEQASGLHAAMSKLGIGTDTVAQASLRLSRQLKMHEDAITSLGVKTRDSSGNFLDLQTVMLSGIDVLNGMKEGIDRNQAAQMMFGRGTGDLTQLLRLNSEAVKEGADTAEKLGLIIGQDGVDAMRRYKASVAESKEVLEALQVAIGNEVLPALTKLGESLAQNGPAAVAKTKAAISDIIAVFHALRVAVDFVDIGLSVLAEGLAELASAATLQMAIVFDAMTMNWGAIKADWKAGLADMVQIHKDAMQQIVDDQAVVFGGAGASTLTKGGKGGGLAGKGFAGGWGKATNTMPAPDSGGGSGSGSGNDTPSASPAQQRIDGYSDGVSNNAHDIATSMAAELSQGLKVTQVGVDKIKKVYVDGALFASSAWKRNIDTISNSWGASLARMATLQQGFGTTLSQMWGMVASLITDQLAAVISSYISKWLTALGIKKAAQAVDGAATVTSEAAKAGAGGIASMAAAPFPLDTSAPAFGASMAAAAMAFMPAASAAGGYDIGPGVNPLTQLHAREMVLPAPVADTVRDAMGGRGSRGGEIAIHIHATDAQSVKRLLTDNSHVVVDAVKAAIRKGKR